MVIVYYKDPQVQVTSEALHIGEARIPLGRIEYVWHREGETGPRVRLRVAQRGVIGFGFVVGGLLALLGVLYLLATVVGQAATAGRVLLPLAGVVALIGFAGPLFEAGLRRTDKDVDQGLRVREIWGVIDGVERCLIRVADTQRFGRIYRALERAIGGYHQRSNTEAQAFADGSEDGT